MYGLQGTKCSKHGLKCKKEQIWWWWDAYSSEAHVHLHWIFAAHHVGFVQQEVSLCT
jgi:hypothetical protein